MCVCVHASVGTSAHVAREGERKGEGHLGGKFSKFTKLKGGGASVEFLKRRFRGLGSQGKNPGCSAGGEGSPPSSDPELPTCCLTRTNPGALSMRRGRATERRIPGNETISSLHSSCRNKSGPPWHLSPPVPPAGLLATCTPCWEPSPGCLRLRLRGPLALPGGVRGRLEEQEGTRGSRGAERWMCARP